MPLVTIARQLGSLGDEIGEALAERMRLRYLDHHVLLGQVREFGEVQPDAPEIAETRPTFWERLNEERRRHAIIVRYGVYTFAREDDGVIVGLGANFLLRNIGHTLRVLTCAPLQLRTERIMEKGAGGRPGQMGREAAAELVRQSDRERGGYIRYMHNADWLDTHNYDLVLNTENHTVEQLVHDIAFAVERAELTPTAQSLQAIDDLTLASRVEAALISNAGIWIHGLKATAERGVVTIAGEVITDEDREYAEEVARGVPDVRIVENELRIQPPPLTGM